MRVLCLHGYNVDAALMEYQMRQMKQVYGDVMEFVTLEGPFECPEDPPAELHRFLKAGQTKFRGWLKFDKHLDPSKKTESPSDISGLEESF